MSIIQTAKQIKDQIEKLQKENVKIMDNTRKGAELQILIRDKSQIQGDLKARGIKWEDV